GVGGNARLICARSLCDCHHLTAGGGPGYLLMKSFCLSFQRLRTIRKIDVKSWRLSPVLSWGNSARMSKNFKSVGPRNASKCYARSISGADRERRGGGYGYHYGDTHRCSFLHHFDRDAARQQY